MSSSGDALSPLDALLRRHKVGDAAALNEIISHAQERLKRLTRQMLRQFPSVQHWEETSDVFHNVLIKLSNALRQLTFDSTSDFLQLAACQIRRELLDLAKRCRTTLISGDSSAPDPLANKPDSTNDPYNLAQWEEVHSKIDQLSDSDRQLFDLLYYQDLSQAEASELLGTSLRTLKRKWQSARENLMRLLGDDPPF